MSEITFRRIRGRIVPIKRSKKDKRSLPSRRRKVAEGVGLAVAGTGLGVGGGVAAAKSIDTANKFQRLSRWNKVRSRHTVKQQRTSQMVLKGLGTPEQRISGMKNRLTRVQGALIARKKAKRLGRASIGLRKAGITMGVFSSLAATSLLTAGIDRSTDNLLSNKYDTVGSDVGKSAIMNTAALGLAGAVTVVAGKRAGGRKVARWLRQKPDINEFSWKALAKAYKKVKK